MTHEPIDGRFWCVEKGDHRWNIGHEHFAPCCLHAAHYVTQPSPIHARHLARLQKPER